jgi:RecA-family ATPase
MKITNASMTEEDILENKTARDEMRIRSSLKCFSSTNGIRPSEFSVLLGASGNGKSTLCRTISVECAFYHTKTLHILSEEKTAVYKQPINERIKQVAKPGTAEKYMNNLLFTSMLDWPKDQKNEMAFFSFLENAVNEHLPELVIFDNFTTSFFNSLHVAKQGEVIDKFRKFASTYDIAILAVFHTLKGTNIYNKLITGEDVRGNSTSTNGSGYVYTIQNFFRAKPEPASVLTIEKARYHSEFNQSYWRLVFDKESGLYVGDKRIEYETLLEIQKSASNNTAKQTSRRF